jgi:hypothetical protein
MSNRFWIGESLRIDASFTDDAGVPVAADGVTAAYRRVSGEIVTVPSGSIEAAGVGTFRIAILPDTAGDYWVRIAAATPTPAVVELRFTIAASNVL